MPPEPTDPAPECPRCSAPAGAVDGAWSCPDHGLSPGLRRWSEIGYDAFARHLVATPGFPTYLPWPLSPGWRITDVAAVGGYGAPVAATLTCVSGTSELDGPVDVLLVVEEAGTGLGGRCAGLVHADPGPGLGLLAPLVRVRAGRGTVPLWPVSVAGADGDLDRSVVAGEIHGRWLWVVVRPASAILLLRDDWILRDVSGVGPPLVELPFGGPGPHW